MARYHDKRMAHPDVAVVGSGVFGAWTAWHLRAAGASVALIDGHGIGHSRAASGGESRIIRVGYGDRALYSRWAREALGQWKRLFEEAGEALFVRTGVLWFARPDDPAAEVTARTVESLGVPLERLDQRALRERFPQFNVEPYAGGADRAGEWRPPGTARGSIGGPRCPTAGRAVQGGGGSGRHRTRRRHHAACEPAPGGRKPPVGGDVRPCVRRVDAASFSTTAATVDPAHTPGGRIPGAAGRRRAVRAARDAGVDRSEGRGVRPAGAGWARRESGAARVWTGLRSGDGGSETDGVGDGGGAARRRGAGCQG